MTIAIILFSLLLSWNWGGSTPQFHVKDISCISEKSIAKIHLVRMQENKINIENTFYNGGNKEINIFYKLKASKSGRSSSTSNQSGNFIVDSKEKVVLSKLTVNLNKDDHYKINLQVFENNRVIAENSASIYGDQIIKN